MRLKNYHITFFPCIFLYCFIFCIFLSGYVNDLKADFTIVNQDFIKTFYIDNSSVETLSSQNFDYSETQQVFFKFLRDKPGATSPDVPVDTCDITLPDLETLTISGGVSLNMGSAFRLIVKGSLLVNGTEKQNIDIKAGRGIHFESAKMPSSLLYCNITGGESESGGGVYVDDFSDLLIDHCTLSSNKAVYGGGIFLTNNADIIITNTILSGNEGSIYGGGLYCLNSSPTLENNIFKNNKHARFGGGVYLSNSNPYFKNNLVTDNSAVYGGGIFLLNSNSLCTNSVICNNFAEDSGGGVYFQGSNPTVSASVICNNLAYENGGGIYLESASPQIINTIIYGNLVSPGDDLNSFDNQLYLTVDSLPDVSYCNIMGGADDISGPGTPAGYSSSNIDEDPLFADPSSTTGPDGFGSNADWSLQPDSYCINTGTSDAQFETADMVGNERPYNEPMREKYTYHEIFTDMGAYEFQNNPPFIGENGDDVFLDSKNVSKSEYLILEDIPGGFDVDMDDVDIVFYSPPAYESSKNSGSLGNDVKNTGNFYQYEEGEDGSVKGVILLHLDTITDPQGRLVFIPPNANDSFTETFMFKAYDGTSFSPNCAMVDISVDATAYHRIVTEGDTTTYYIDNTSTYQLVSSNWALSRAEHVKFDFLKNLDGETIPDDPVDSCEIILGSGQVLTIGGGVQLDLGTDFSLTIEGSINAVGTEDQPIDIKAGNGIKFSSNPNDSSFVYCNISNGTGSLGGALYVQKSSAIVIDHCNFYSNSAASGGAFFLTDNADITLRNCQINNNSASRFGGGIYCFNSYPVLENNIINNNTAAQSGGGVYLENSSPQFNNNIVCDNTAAYGGGVYAQDSTPLIINCVICNNLSENSGGGLYLKGSSLNIINNDICNNLAYDDGGGVYLEDASPVFVNDIIYGNSISKGAGGAVSNDQVYISQGSTPELSYSDLMDGESGLSGSGSPSLYTSNIDEYPMFVLPTIVAGTADAGAEADWSLQADSPCINRGSKSSTGLTTDIEGIQRPYNGAMKGEYAYDEIAVDMGAHEFPNNPPFIGTNGQDIVYPLAYAKEGSVLTLMIQGGFDVDNDSVAAVYYDPPADDSQNQDTVIKGRLYQYGESSGNQDNASSKEDDSTEKDNSSGTELVHLSAITDPKYRFYYGPPEVEESFTDILMFKAYDGTGISPNTITVNVYVTAVENTEKEIPNASQENTLEALGNVDEDYVSSNHDVVITSITEVAGLEMNDFQKNSFLNGVRSVTTSQPLDNTQKIALLDALDAFCTNNPENTAVLLSDSQASQLVFALEQIEAKGAMHGDEIEKCAKIINDLIEQKGGVDQLSKELNEQINQLSNALVDQASGTGFDIYRYAVGGTSFQALIYSNIDTSPDGGDASLDSLAATSRMEISREQVDELLNDLNAFLSDQEHLTQEQSNQATGILDTLISRNEVQTLSLTESQINNIQEKVELLVSRSAFLFDEFSVDSFTYIRYWINAMDFTNRSDDIFIGDAGLQAPGVVVPGAAMAELGGLFGTQKIRLCLVYQEVTTVADGSLLSVYFINEASEAVPVKDLANPIKINISLLDENRIVPKWHDTGRVEWRTDGITGVDDSVNGMISFYVNHLTDFALFGDSDNDITTDSDRSDSNVGSSGCFINTVFN